MRAGRWVIQTLSSMVLLFAALAASAHKPSDSYLGLDWQGERIVQETAPCHLQCETLGVTHVDRNLERLAFQRAA